MTPEIGENIKFFKFVIYSYMHCLWTSTHFNVTVCDLKKNCVIRHSVYVSSGGVFELIKDHLLVDDMSQLVKYMAAYYTQINHCF